jgi:hypothetical protein
MKRKDILGNRILIDGNPSIAGARREPERTREWRWKIPKQPELRTQQGSRL